MRNSLFLLLPLVAFLPSFAQPTPPAGSLYGESGSRIAGSGLEGLLGPKSADNLYDRRMVVAAERALERAQRKATGNAERITGAGDSKPPKASLGRIRSNVMEGGVSE